MKTLLAITAATLLAGAACAQTAPSTPPQTTPPNPSAAPTPNATTPPGGIARGVIPAQPVDPGMVAAPPSNARGGMPVIRPPGSAR